MSRRLKLLPRRRPVLQLEAESRSQPLACQQEEKLSPTRRRSLPGRPEIWTAGKSRRKEGFCFPQNVPSPCPTLRRGKHQRIRGRATRALQGLPSWFYASSAIGKALGGRCHGSPGLERPEQVDQRAEKSVAEVRSLAPKGPRAEAGEGPRFRSALGHPQRGQHLVRWETGRGGRSRTGEIREQKGKRFSSAWGKWENTKRLPFPWAT